LFGKTPPDLDLFPTSGSSNGQKDFANDENHFGAGDIPFKTTNTKTGYVNVDYTTIKTTNNKPFFHIPFQLGAIGIFHSVPDSAGKKVDLDGCVLAKIFSRQIKFWDHADIKKLNPTLSIPANTPIKVATRTSGSSSTSLTTQYLNLMAGASSTDCANAWTLGSGSTIDWPADVDKVEGSSGMSGFLAKNEWSIGYVDAGHGHEKGLKEVELKNKAGKWVTSKTADIAAAGDAATGMPTDFSADWNGFNLMNADGDETFPICTFSYMYIHKKIQDSESARLLQAFATFVLSDDGQGMLSEFGFVKLSTATLAKSRAALALVDYATDGGGVTTNPWKFEASIDKTGASKGSTAGTWPTTDNAVTVSTPNGNKIFSVKRGAWGDYSRGVLESDLDKLVARVAVLEGHHDEPLKWYEDPKKQIDGALALGSLAFILGFIGTVLGGVALTKIKRMSGGKYSNNIV
jgi:ABC-type phosphate transport system substrate-binding protein